MCGAPLDDWFNGGSVDLKKSVDKQKSLKKKTRKNVEEKQLIGDPCEAIYKLMLKNMSHQKMYHHCACRLSR